MSAQKASQIHLRLPPINAPALIVRFSQELHIPQVHAVQALALRRSLLAIPQNLCECACHVDTAAGHMLEIPG